MKPEYLLCVGQIIDGARTGDFARVTAYANFLAEKLKANGETKEAARIIEALNGTGHKVHLVW